MASEEEINQSSDTGNMPLDEANQSSTGKVKEYGKKGFAPLIDLVHRYRGDMNPYIDALEKGLKAATDSFQSANSDAEKTVAKWFQETSSWFEGIKGKLQSAEPKELLNYIESEAKKRPGVMFASSYVVGMVFGRLGRHMVRMKSSGASDSADESFTPTPDQIH